jgi:Mn-dependent DtxR family transcriptional regulator
MALFESGEMYLETILLLSRKQPRVRAIDVGTEMGFSKPSVSRALGILKKDGYLTVDPDGHIALTESGRAVAEKIYERHTLITAVLTDLGVDKKIAAADACRIEHVISEESFEVIRSRYRKKEEA